MPSPWLAVGPETDPLTRARQLQTSWERLLAEGALGPDLPPEATAGLRPSIVESWRRSLATGLDPTELAPPIEVDRSEMRGRWLEHPLGQLGHVLAAQLGGLAEESRSLVVVADASGLLLHIDGAESLKERAREMNFVEGARLGEAVDGTNGIGTPLRADHALQVFAFEHFNQRHHQWICSGAPVHDPVSGRIVGLVDLSSFWNIAHPRSLELVTTAARTMERCLLDARRDQDARLRRRYSDFMTRSTDLLVNRYGYVLEGDEPPRATPFDVPDGGGEIVLHDRSVAVAEPVGQGEAYLVRRLGSRGAKSACVDSLERAEVRAHELAAEQAALRQVATLVARESSPDQLFAVVAKQVARVFDVPIVRLVRYEPDGSVLVGGFGTGSGAPFPVGSRWPMDNPGVMAAVRRSGRAVRVQDYADMDGQAAAAFRRSGMRSAVGSPIVVEGRLWGAMVIASPRREPLPEDTEARLSDFTELVATAIANAESRAAVGRLVEEQAALRRVATLVARGISPEEMFSAVSNEAGRLFGAEAAIARFEPDGSSMVVVGVTPGIPVVSIGTRWQLEDYLASTTVYRTGRPARSDHTGHRDAIGPVANSLRQMNFVSTVAAPITVEGSLWGVMTLSDERKPLPPNAGERVAKFTELVATAIANAESRAELRASEARAHDLATEQAALRRVATRVAEGARADELFATVAREVADVVGIPVIGLHRFEGDGTFTMVGIAGDTSFTVGSRWPVDDEGLAGRILATGRPARKDDYTSMPGPLGAAMTDDMMIATVGVPIVVEGSIWGFMVGAARPGESIREGTEERLARFTDLVATAIANSQARERLAQLVDEQAALRRVATLVAQDVPASELFGAVAREVGTLFGADFTGMLRYESDPTIVTTMATWAAVGEHPPAAARSRTVPGDPMAMVADTGKPARVEDWTSVPGPIAEFVRRELGVTSSVGCPIVVQDHLWGALAVHSKGGPLPPDTESHLLNFTRLVATAIANTNARAEASTLTEEQAALRRVATLVARGAGARELFSAVVDEVGRLFGSDQAGIARYEPDGSGIVVLGAGRAIRGVPVGTRVPLDDFLASAEVYRTGRSATKSSAHDETAFGTIADTLREMNASTVAAPIVVEGRLWGVITVSEPRGTLPPDSEERIGNFTELVATAIANAESRAELAASEARARSLAGEQAALRRVATLVAKGARPDEVFSAVADEIEGVLDIDLVTICRCEPDGFLIVSSSGIPGFGAGSRLPPDVPSLPAFIHRSGGPVRIDDFTNAEGLNAAARDAGIRAAVGAPIIVAGTAWGSVCAASTKNEPLPLGTEDRLARFTDLAATSVSNAIMRDELAASRARVIAAADGARRRIERDLHDGAQQRLVTLAVALRRAETKIPAGSDELHADLTRVADGLTAAVQELREMSRGIHPAVLTEGGLSPALKALGRRSTVRVKLDIDFEHRLPDQVEVAAYYTVSEALTNASKHANCARVWVSLRFEDDILRLSIRDDGVGGADASRGSGLTGIKDRIEALGGKIQIESPTRRGTRIAVEIPMGESPDRRGDRSDQTRAP
jgi:GAF domain-containing protein